MKSEVSEEIHKILLQLEPLFFWHTFKRLHENNDFFFFFVSENFSKQRYPVSNPENIVQVALLTFFPPKEIFFSFRKHFSYLLVEKVQQLPSFFLLFKKSKETNCQEKGGRKLSLMEKKWEWGDLGQMVTAPTRPARKIETILPHWGLHEGRTQAAVSHPDLAEQRLRLEGAVPAAGTWGRLSAAGSGG